MSLKRKIILGLTYFVLIPTFVFAVSTTVPVGKNGSSEYLLYTGDSFGVGTTTPVGQGHFSKAFSPAGDPSPFNAVEDPGLLSDFLAGDNPQYKIYSYDNLGTSKVFTTVPLDTGISITQNGYSVALSWSTDSTADGYRVFRDRNSTGTFTEYTDVSGPTVVLTDRDGHVGQSFSWISGTEASNTSPSTYTMGSRINYTSGTGTYGFYTNGSGYIGQNILIGGLTASQLVATDSLKNLVSLSTSTYPSLTELTFLKGTSSAIQTQLNLKAPLASPTFTGTVTIPTPFTLGATSVTSTGTKLNYLTSATGTTGTTSTNLVFSGSPTLTTASLGSSTATTQSANDNSTKLATTAYVDGALATFDSKTQVAYGSTSALPSNTYSNGSSGVGATLTGTANGPLIIDGVTILVGQVGSRVLVTGEGTSANNGWYTITQQGVVAVSPYILTRATDADQAAEIGSGYITSVIAPNGVTAGSANNGKVFISVAAADPFTIGTTNLTFSQVGSTYSAGTGLGLSGNTFSIDTATTVDKTTAQVLTNKDLSSTTNTFPASVGGCMEPMHANIATVLDSTTYYWGAYPVSNAPPTSGGSWRIYLPKTGTIKAITISSRISGTLGSNEPVTFNFVLNNTTSTAITTTGQLTAANQVQANYALSISVTAGDYFEINDVIPNMATNPTGLLETAIVCY